MHRDLGAFARVVRPSRRSSVASTFARSTLVVAAAAANGCTTPTPSPAVVEVAGATGSAPAMRTVDQPTASGLGGKCQVKGTALPWNGCEAVYPVLTQTIDGVSRTIAEVRGDADVVLTFEGAPATLTVSAASSALRARGTVDPAKTWLPLARGVDVFDGHGKVFAGAPVLVKAVRQQLDVEVWIGIGAEPVTTSVRVACDDVVFAPRELARLESQQTSNNVLQPKGALHLHDAPGGRAFLEILPGMSKGPRPPGAVGAVSRAANLVPLERRAGFTRVAFEAPFLALDAWVPDGEVMEDEAQGFGGGIGCGTGKGFPGGKSARAIKDAPLLLAGPGGKPTPVDVTLRANAVVLRHGAEGALSQISLPRDSILPPHGSQFWVESSALEDVLPKP